MKKIKEFLKYTFIGVISVPLLFSAFVIFILLFNFGDNNDIVAVIDSGVDYNHEVLKGKVMEGYDFVDMDNDAMDENGHGTHISGIILSQSPTSTILPVRILDEDGEGKVPSFIPILYAIVNGADVINMSYSEGGHNYLSQWMINIANKKGIVLVAATGNDGANEINYPAKYNNVLAIGASDNYNGLYDYSNKGEGLDFLAPGVSIKSSDINNQYSAKSGTSLSSAYVSGVISYLKVNNPSLKTKDILNTLNESSNPAIYQDEQMKVLDKDKLIAKEKKSVYVWIHTPKSYVESNKVSFDLHTMNADNVQLVYDRNNEVLSQEGDINTSVDVELTKGTHRFVLTAEKNGKYYSKYFNITVDKEHPEVAISKLQVEGQDFFKVSVKDDSLKEIEIENSFQAKTKYMLEEVDEEYNLYIPMKLNAPPLKITATDHLGRITEYKYDDKLEPEVSYALIKEEDTNKSKTQQSSVK